VKTPPNRSRPASQLRTYLDHDAAPPRAQVPMASPLPSHLHSYASAPPASAAQPMVKGHFLPALTTASAVAPVTPTTSKPKSARTSTTRAPVSTAAPVVASPRTTQDRLATKTLQQLTFLERLPCDVDNRWLVDHFKHNLMKLETLHQEELSDVRAEYEHKTKVCLWLIFSLSLCLSFYLSISFSLSHTHTFLLFQDAHDDDMDVFHTYVRARCSNSRDSVSTLIQPRAVGARMSIFVIERWCSLTRPSNAHMRPCLYAHAHFVVGECLSLFCFIVFIAQLMIGG
jgi:hypothetical protein